MALFLFAENIIHNPLHDIANSGCHRNGCCGADFNYPQGENSLSFFQTVEVGLVLISGSYEMPSGIEELRYFRNRQTL